MYVCVLNTHRILELQQVLIYFLAIERNAQNKSHVQVAA